MFNALRRNSTIIFCLLAVVLVLPAVILLIHPGFPVTDDGDWMVIRFSAFYETLKSGQFPVRFLMRLNNGYGYPVADFLYPLFMYLATPFQILGIGFVNSIKAVLILSLVLSSIFTYLWLRKLFDNLSSLVGSFFYTYFPYHLFDIYKRGSVGEVLSLTVVPFVLWQIERNSLFWSSIGISFLILSHNSLAVLFLAVILIYMVLNIYISSSRKNLFLRYLSMLMFGFGMSSFFSIPAIFDLQYTVFYNTVVSDFSQYFADLNLIGLPSVLVIIFTFILIFTKHIKLKAHRLTLLFLVLSLISIFFAMSPSAFLWKILPVSFIQFPFRLLSVTMLSVSFLAACVIYVLPKKHKIFMIVIFLVIVFVYAMPYLKVSSFQDYPDTFYSTNQDTTTVKNEYMPKWVKKVPSSMYSEKIENLSGEEKIDISKATPNETVFSVFLTKESEIEVNTIYFPGWTAYVNGEKRNINYNNEKGVIRLILSKGQNDVRIEFQETNVRSLSNLISLFFLIVLIIYSLPFKNRIKNKIKI